MLASLCTATLCQARNDKQFRMRLNNSYLNVTRANALVAVGALNYSSTTSSPSRSEVRALWRIFKSFADPAIGRSLVGYKLVNDRVQRDSPLLVGSGWARWDPNHVLVFRLSKDVIGDGGRACSVQGAERELTTVQRLAPTVVARCRRRTTGSTAGFCRHHPH